MNEMQSVAFPGEPHVCPDIPLFEFFPPATEAMEGPFGSRSNVWRRFGQVLSRDLWRRRLEPASARMATVARI